MLTSTVWMNEYLDPPASADEQAELLTRAGFPLEGREPLSGSDVRQDFEMTSNRGDCISHVGLAREIAAISGRTFKTPDPAPQATGPPAKTAVTVTNQESDLCPLYTARIIRGVKVGPSPKWLADRLLAIHQIPRNNIVDASNFVLFELGQPTHLFDLPKLKGSRIIIRRAAAGERLLPIGEGAEQVILSDQDLVIADAERPVALAGVKGGAATAVTKSSTDILIEAATFDPLAVRNTSRRHSIDSDSSYRFERGVHPGQIEGAADRLAELIMEVAGGELAEGVVSDGAPMRPPVEVSMRTQRCRDVLGMPISDEQMVTWLNDLEFAPQLNGGVIRCTVPVHRLDVNREIDLVEEVGRMMGHDNLPVTDTIQVRVAPLQSTELAARAVKDTLVGMGFVETVSHGLIEAADAEPFLPDGSQPLRLERETVGGHTGSVLRPSVLPSLLRVLARNHDTGTRQLQIFEPAATFIATGETHLEVQKLGLVADVPDLEDGLRPLRGAVERLLEMLTGDAALTRIIADDTASWFAPGAIVKVGETSIGRLGMITPAVAGMFGLDDPVAAAELELTGIAATFPPDTEARALPSFPVVERDLSVVVDEDVPWERLRGVVVELDPVNLEAIEFVASYRGRQIGAGRKSVTMRLRFRASDRTLVAEAVDSEVRKVVKALKSAVKAQIRG